MMAASTPNRSAANTVTSATRSGFLHRSRKGVRSRISRYSRMYRPAWRISQTGGAGSTSRRQARRKGLARSASPLSFGRFADIEGAILTPRSKPDQGGFPLEGPLFGEERGGIIIDKSVHIS
jgi:hypothetical protein